MKPEYNIGDQIVYESIDGVVVIAEVEGVKREPDGSWIYAVRALVAEHQLAGGSRFPDLRPHQILGGFTPPEPQWSFYQKMLEDYESAAAVLIDAGDRLISAMMRFSDKGRQGLIDPPKQEEEENPS